MQLRSGGQAAHADTTSCIEAMWYVAWCPPEKPSIFTEFNLLTLGASSL